MADLEIRLLGIPKIYWHGDLVHIRWRKATAMLAYLALHPHAHNRTVLADILWPNVANSRANLRRLLYNLKSSGIDAWLITDDATVCLNPAISVHVDAVELETLMKASDTDEERLKQTVDLYVDEFMSGFFLEEATAFNDWVQHRRQLFHRYYIDALETLARNAQDTGRLNEAAEYANRILELDPLVESVHRLLMRLYVQMKQHDRAISQYHQLVKFLREELGLTPQAATRKLYEDLLNAEVRPEDTEPLFNVKELQAVSLLPPKPDDIVGRNDVINDLRETLFYGDATTIGISGIPGVGKTALVSLLVHEPEVRAVFPDGIFWITLGEAPDIHKQLEIWCGTLNIMPETTQETTTMKIRATIARRRMLIVVDDVWEHQHVQPFLAHGEQSKIIVTSHFPGVARQIVGHNGYSIYLPPLDETHARELVKLFAPDVFEDYPDEVDSVLNTISGHPCSLALLGELVAGEYEIGLVDSSIRRTGRH